MMKKLSIVSPLLLPQVVTSFAPPKTCTPIKIVNHISYVSRSDITDSLDINETNGEGEATKHNAQDYSQMTILPRHPTNDVANQILIQTEEALKKMQERELFLAAGEESNAIWSRNVNKNTLLATDGEEEIPMEVEQESVYANSYVDLGKVDTVGFDFDYTLVTYTQQLLELIYDMALRRLVNEKEYPSAMLSSGLKVRFWFV
jgi:hypothetical protein